MICGILAAFSFLYLIPTTINSANASNVNIEDELIVTLLNSYTMEAIQKYYGELRGYDINNAKVNKILKATSGENVYQVEIHITTYVGPFNPPYGNDILFFTATPAFVRLDKYEHKDRFLSLLLRYIFLVSNKLYHFIRISSFIVPMPSY